MGVNSSVKSGSNPECRTIGTTAPVRHEAALDEVEDGSPNEGSELFLFHPPFLVHRKHYYCCLVYPFDVEVPDLPLLVQQAENVEC